VEQIERLWEESPLACIIVGVLIVLILAIGSLVASRKVRKVNGAVRVVALAGIVGVALILLVLILVEPLERWGWTLALLPAVMVGQHAAFLRLVRMPFRAPLTRDGSSTAGSMEDNESWGAMRGEDLRRIFAAARRNSDRYFSPSTLAIRYATPAVAIALVGIVIFYLLFVRNASTLDPNIKAAKLGIAGAYVYVLLYLGQRNFRQDVTSGGAMWCAVLLALGPVLAWAISHFSHGDLQPGAPPPKDELSNELIYFAAGLAPRHVAAFVEETIRRVWVSPSNVAMAMPRTIPITQVKGITTGIAERMSEEGILDVYGLANADPLRLIRNTNFDKRQIIAWIDEAILISVLPDHWQALEKAGFTGAIDVVWLKPPTSAVNDPQIVLLSQLLKFDSPAILAGVIERLATDAQLRLVLVLYRLIDRLEAESELESNQLRPVHQGG
jgi:hypothetical protein